MVDLKTLALTMVILVITVSIGIKIVSTTRDTFASTETACTDSNASTICTQPTEYLNADTGASAIGDFSDWYAILIITGVGAAVIGMLGLFSRNAQ